MADERTQVRGLAVFLVTHGCTCCVLPTTLPTLNTAVGVAFMARQVSSQVGNETSEDYETHFVRLLYINSLNACPAVPHAPSAGRRPAGNVNVSVSVGCVVPALPVRLIEINEPAYLH
jgi:hypothetical protein